MFIVLYGIILLLFWTSLLLQGISFGQFFKPQLVVINSFLIFIVRTNSFSTGILLVVTRNSIYSKIHDILISLENKLKCIPDDEIKIKGKYSQFQIFCYITADRIQLGVLRRFTQCNLILDNI